MTRQTLMVIIPLFLLGLVFFSNVKMEIKPGMPLQDEPLDPRLALQESKRLDLSGADGPYLFWRGDSLQVVHVNATLQLQQKLIKPNPNTTFTCRVANKDKDEFSFTLQPKLTTPPSTYEQPDKVLAISDIEGNFNAFYSLLRGNGVMNEQYQWTFGDGHLVLVGDFVDRGDNVTQCLWLIYKLEQEAIKYGGQVHYILGNHEVMNLEYDFRYVNRKYLTLAQQLTGKVYAADAFPLLMSDENVLVQWLKTRNCMEKIGDILYVHAGISEELLKTKLSTDEINTTLRNYLNTIDDTVAVSDSRMALVIGGGGPLWYRGLVKKQTNEYEKAVGRVVNQALRHFRVKKIVIGHTVVREISTDYNGKVVRIDLHQPIEKSTGKAQALLIENGMLYRVNDLGKRVLLK